MKELDNHDKASQIFLTLKKELNRYVPLLDLLGMVKASDSYLLTQDDGNIYLEFIFKKDKTKK